MWPLVMQCISPSPMFLMTPTNARPLRAWILLLALNGIHLSYVTVQTGDMIRKVVLDQADEEGLVK